MRCKQSGLEKANMKAGRPVIQAKVGSDLDSDISSANGEERMGSEGVWHRESINS
jgi:hypothetical protein